MLTRFNNFLITKSMVSNTTIHNYNSANPLNWQNGQYLHSNDLKFVNNRMVLHQGKNKYAEKISFAGKGNNYAVAIGYNPATYCGTTIDKSNYLISTLFHNKKYDGYYLFNMYPDISVQKIKKNNSSYSDYILDVLDFLIRDLQNSPKDVFIFWGSSVYITIDVENKLNALQNVGITIYTIGTHNTPHQHPGRNVSIKTIDCTLANLNSIVPNHRFLQ